MDANLDNATTAGTISARIDRLPATRTIWRIVILLSFGMFFELYDLLFSGYVAPGLVKSGLLSPNTPGLFGTSGVAGFIAALFTGLFLGTLLCGFLADRFGRRAVFTGSLFWYTAANVMVAVQTTAFGLDFWRLISGIGLGLEMVTIGAYLSELAPKAIRGRVFAISQAIGFSSVPVISWLAYQLVPHAPFGIASGESPGRPAASLLWRASQWISGLPRISHPPTLPAMRLRVAPNSASSGVPAMNPRVAPVVSSSCAAPGESPGCPEFPLPLQRRRRIFGFPRISRPSGCTVPASPGFPDSCSYGWADDDSPNLLELCILGRAADESSCPIGSCTFPPDPGCLLNISSVFHRRQADSELPSSIKSCIVLPGWNCVSNSLQGHQLRRRVGLFNLWKQVQKMESPVDITKVGA